VTKRIDTGVTFITTQNVDEPEIQQLINPDIQKWLNME